MRPEFKRRVRAAHFLNRLVPTIVMTLGGGGVVVLKPGKGAPTGVPEPSSSVDPPTGIADPKSGTGGPSCGIGAAGVPEPRLVLGVGAPRVVFGVGAPPGEPGPRSVRGEPVVRSRSTPNCARALPSRWGSGERRGSSKRLPKMGSGLSRWRSSPATRTSLRTPPL